MLSAYKRRKDDLAVGSKHPSAVFDIDRNLVRNVDGGEASVGWVKYPDVVGTARHKDDLAVGSEHPSSVFPCI